MRATSPKLRVNEAGDGSVISPEPIGADSAKEALVSLELRRDRATLKLAGFRHRGYGLH
jgi:hypothetical protein